MESKISIKEYLTALTENRLLGLKCRDCGFVTAPPRLACRKCGGLDSHVVELSGKGKIVTFTVVYLPPENRRGQPPYLVVIVELDEGAWIMGNLSGPDPAKATLELIGKRVRMQNHPLPEGQKAENGVPPVFVLEAE
jgi:uncharacterized OB-fold protein